MSNHTPLIRYKAAQLRVSRAAELCPHWDYESHGSREHECCIEYAAALRERKLARAAIDKVKE